MRWPTIKVCVASAALLCVARLSAQSSDTTSFVTTVGKDTVAVEQYTRIGNTITGTWIQSLGGAIVHDYALVLRNDGWPAHYMMTLYMPRPHTYLMSITYGPDTATRIVVRDSTAVTDRIAAQKAYPVGAESVLGVELALARARRARTDSATITLVRGQGPPQMLPVKFFGVDSVRIGEATGGRIDQNGRLLALHNGAQETRRVPSVDLAKAAAGFIAADAATAAARVEITLSPAALQRFVGEYALTPTVSVAVTLEGNALMLHAGKQPVFQLFAQSPTTFFLKAAPVIVEFDTDAAGNVAGLSLVQGAARQRAARKPR